jgi:hypothetical protein
MAQLAETDQTGKLQDISDVIACVKAKTTPFTSVVRQAKDLKQRVQTWQTETIPDAGHEGVMDGKDVDAFDSVPRATLTGVAQHFRRTYKITQFADVTAVAGLGGKKEKQNQRAKALVILKLKKERRYLSDSDCADDNGTNQPNETRGAYSWLSTTKQTNYPVPDAYLLPTAQAYTGAIASLTEAVFSNMCDAAFKQTNEHLTLMGIAGIELIAQMTAWTVTADAGASFGTFPIRTFTNDAKAKLVIRAVQRLEMNSATIQLMKSGYLLTNVATGAVSTSSYKSGLFLNMNLWEISSLKGTTERELPDLGGGPRGLCESMEMLKCLNPLGNLVVKSST